MCYLLGRLPVASEQGCESSQALGSQRRSVDPTGREAGRGPQDTCTLSRGPQGPTLVCLSGFDITQTPISWASCPEHAQSCGHAQPRANHDGGRWQVAGSFHPQPQERASLETWEGQGKGGGEEDLARPNRRSPFTRRLRLQFRPTCSRGS